MSTTAHEKNARAGIDLATPKHVKRSKSQRKFLNQMRGMGDVPWPARRFKVAPTFGGVRVVGQCQRVLGVTKIRRGRLKRREDAMVVCGGPIVLEPFKGAWCVDCRNRKRQARALERMKRRQPWRAPHQQHEQMRERGGMKRLIQRFRRGG